jgi:predicted MFS family arabinose efflux permease
LLAAGEVEEDGMAGASARPFAVVAVSFLAIGLGTAPAFLFGFLAPVLQADLGLSRTQLGLLVGIMFGATGLGSIPAGRVVGLLGARWSVVVEMALVAVALLVPVLRPGYPALVACALLSGLGYALANVATNVAVAAALPPRRHGVGLAVKTSGVPAIVVLTSLVTPALGEAYGWRPVMLWSVPLLVLVGVAAAATLPDARTRAGGARGGVLPRSFFRFPLAAALLIGGTQPIYSWAVPFLHESVGASLAVAGAVTALASLLALAPMIGVARLSDRLGAARRLPMATGLCAITAVAVLLLAVSGASVVLAACGLVVATIAQLAAVSLMHASVVAVAPLAVGRASGFAMVGFYTGALIAAPLFGMVVDLTGSYPLAWVECAVATGLAAACFWWCRSVAAVTTGPASLPTARPAH